VLSASDLDNKVAWYENNTTPSLGLLPPVTVDEDALEQTVSLVDIGLVVAKIRI
jgi:hypothetical protein